jgi:chemotaxis protein CheC
LIEVGSLNPVQLDALREVANMGAGHAATALSAMTEQRIMITVPRLTIAPLEEVPSHLSTPEEPVAAVLMNIMGEVRGRALLVFQQGTAVRLAEILTKRAPGSCTELGALETSAIREAANILAGAYVTALGDFTGLRFLLSPPSLAIDMAQAVLTTAYAQFGSDPECVFCIETEFCMEEAGDRVKGHFLLLPDVASLETILRAARLT